MSYCDRWRHQPIAPGRRSAAIAASLILGVALASPVRASTYVVYIPTGDPIYGELDTLDGLGLLDSYLPEVKPISRVEAARLVLEGTDNLGPAGSANPLAAATLEALRAQLALEVG